MAEAVSGSVKTLRYKRAALKRKISTGFENALEVNDVETKAACREMILETLPKIRTYDEQINELFLEDVEEQKVSAELDKELDSQALYELKVKKLIRNLTCEPTASGVENLNEFKLKLPDLKCPTFDGEGCNNMEYHAFMSTFNNVIGLRSNVSDSTKLTYLKTYLRGYAQKLILNLQITEDNYKIALELLNNEFLNKDAIKSELFSKLLNLKPDTDREFLKTRIYINEIKCILSDLKMYDTDLTLCPSSKDFLSHIVYSKLPMNFRQELVRRLNNNYPSLDDVYENYIEVIKTLSIKSNFHEKNSSMPQEKGKNNFFQQNNSVSSNPAGTSGEVRRNCKFCGGTSHSMFHCKKYPSYDSRVKRCKEMNLCTNCSSLKHNKDGCVRLLDFPCSICQSKNHISALCAKYGLKSLSNICINNSDSTGNPFILPTLMVAVAYGSKKLTLRCLVDFGSQRSYLSQRIFTELEVDSNMKNKYLINTFLNSKYKTFHESSLSLKIGDDKSIVMPFLFDSNFNLSFRIEGLSLAHKNIEKKYKLAETLVSDQVILDGILGVDALQSLYKLEMVSCLGGVALKFKNGLVPYGHVDNFLSNEQLENKYSDFEKLKFNSSIINSVIEPVKTGFDPISAVCKDNMMDDRLDQMFKIEDLGIREEICDYDQTMIEKFDKEIILRDNCYYVALPWKPAISQVKSNFEISKAILDKVVDKLTENNIFDSYSEILQNYLKDGIIERVEIKEVNVRDFVWIPHRPVIKNDDMTTTKIRIVLNCSMKIHGSPSLNEAAYPGVNLMGDLLELLIKSRCNDFLVISDIKSAFLMIKLKYDEDKNKFAILWRDDTGNLIAYRYKTIVFGFASSPFILNQIIKFHIKNYPNDKCTHFLNKNIYVDNLFFTGDSFHTLVDYYAETSKRMAEGGFILRSWASNCTALKDKFLEDQTHSTHGGTIEKLLGYEYDTLNDVIKLSNPGLELGNKVMTKRFMLSLISQFFDPLGLFLPVTVEGKILMRDTWARKLEWDQQLPSDLVTSWKKHLKNLNFLPKLRFKRRAFKGKIELVVFTDAAKEAYGCAYYACYNDKGKICSSLLFAKAKVSPMKPKTLPTLELLGVFLGLKCASVVLSAVVNEEVLVNSLTFCTDSQVVLSWILTKNLKSKNVFVSNRIKDINQMCESMKNKYNIDCNFKYVCTEQNPCDLITRGISFRIFQSKFNFWENGPLFLKSSPLTVPISPLQCLSDNSKAVMCSNVVSTEEIFSLDKYSSFNKLLRVVSLVLEFTQKCRKFFTSQSMCVNEARIYLIKIQQKLYFSEEISYFSMGKPSFLPNRIKNLNLFLDSDLLIRSRGRLDQCAYLSKDVKNPILLPRESYLTELIIMHFHLACMHLGVGTTVNYVRNAGFWIIKIRSLVKRVIFNCFVCKRINNNHFRYPKPADLPSDRVNLVKPFEYTGIDFSGHIFVKFGNEVLKTYLLLFTCLNVRAIHLELVPSMSCKHFLQAFIRFTNLYHIPKCIYSDNASTFIQAAVFLGKSSSGSIFDEYLVKNQIKHIRIPVRSAWVGATWERMIRSVKSCLYKLTGRKRHEYFDLITIFFRYSKCS